METQTYTLIVIGIDIACFLLFVIALNTMYGE
jgi:hypothetical protein